MTDANSRPDPLTPVLTKRWLSPDSWSIRTYERLEGYTALRKALAAQPDVVEKIRGGKVQAAGAVVGAVMKATGGKADAKRVRELILAACGQ